MSILTVSNVAKSFGGDLLFSEVSFTLAAGQKMGLIGRNGGGKTTLLKIILGQETPDASVVGPMKTVLPARAALASGRTLGYLRQEAPVHPHHTIREEIEEALGVIRNIEARMAAAEEAMATATDDAALEQAIDDFTHASDDYQAHGGYEAESERDAVLLRLGFGPEMLEKKVGSCSGGEQTRLALTKLVLTKPDLLVLDEPTNHLDINATEWLEGFLREYDGAVLIVSHDRFFLDSVVDTIAEIEHQRLTVYKGNYTKFREQKEERLVRQAEVYANQQAEIQRLQGLIKRNMGADANASNIRLKTQGRIARMEKDNVEAVRVDNRTVRAKINSADAGRIGREVVRIEGLCKKYGSRTLFSGMDAVVERNDRVGLVGPNGAGKTTLVRILLGEEAPTEGTLLFGNNVKPSYFSQHATDALDVERTVLDSLLDEAEGFTETQARNYLARFLFTGDDVAKRVRMLSGGEKSKLALARMLLKPCNLLILDEPTNHLDIPSCETLTEMLQQYEGTLMLVSHDRYLLNAVTEKTLGLVGDGTSAFVEGNYAIWREETQKKVAKPAKPTSANGSGTAKHPSTNGNGSARLLANSKPIASTTSPKPVVAAAHNLNPRDLGKARAKARDAVEKGERAVQKLELRLGEVESLLSSGSRDANVVTLAAEHTRLTGDVAAAVAAWEAAVAEQEALGV